MSAARRGWLLAAALLAVAAPLHAQRRDAAPWAPAPAPLAREAAAPLSTGRYAGMAAAGTLGSATGLLAGLLASGAIRFLQGPCGDCDGFQPVDYLFMGAASTTATAFAVASIADPPESLEFRPGAAEIARSPVLPPALLGAAMGAGTGVLLARAVGSVGPDDPPYDLIAFGVGQALTSVLVVRIFTR